MQTWSVTLWAGSTSAAASQVWCSRGVDGGGGGRQGFGGQPEAFVEMSVENALGWQYVSGFLLGVSFLPSSCVYRVLHAGCITAFFEPLFFNNVSDVFQVSTARLFHGLLLPAWSSDAHPFKYMLTPFRASTCARCQSL
jgi:hypothetical protein